MARPESAPAAPTPPIEELAPPWRLMPFLALIAATAGGEGGIFLVTIGKGPKVRLVRFLGTEAAHTHGSPELEHRDALAGMAAAEEMATSLGWTSAQWVQTVQIAAISSNAAGETWTCFVQPPSNFASGWTIGVMMVAPEAGASIDAMLGHHAHVPMPSTSFPSWQEAAKAARAWRPRDTTWCTCTDDIRAVAPAVRHHLLEGEVRCGQHGALATVAPELVTCPECGTLIQAELRQCGAIEPRLDP